MSRRRNDSDWRRDGWRLPDWSVQRRGWCNINNICMHAVPRGDLRLRDHADNCVLLGQLRSRVLLPRRRDVVNWRRDGWRLPDRSVQHSGWNNFNDICVHAVPRGDLRLRDHADNCVVLWHVHSRFL